jgi:hypothetical protein
MEVAHIQSFARQLYEAQGSKAIAEAAQKAAAYEQPRSERRSADLAADQSCPDTLARAARELSAGQG